MKSKAKKVAERRKEEILKNVPAFINQLLLLMNSGMVMQAAFNRICEGYENLPKERQNVFTVEMCGLCRAAKQTGENVIVSFYGFCRRSNIKELTRLGNILLENMDKGTDLWEQLCDEGEQLWQERKRLALEKIRLAESKMSFPLGLLLMALIVVTAAPPMMEM